MKRKITLGIEISKIIISCLMIPLYFIPILHDVAHYPRNDESGIQYFVKVDYFYSIYDKLFGHMENALPLLGISIAVIAISIAISVLCIVLKKNNKPLLISSHIIFGLSIVLFLIVVLLAESFNLYY